MGELIEPRWVEWDPKAPGEAVRYGLLFDIRLDAGVTLGAATWTFARASDGAAGSVSKSAELVSGQTASLLVAGGALGEEYVFTCSVPSSDGQTLIQTAVLRIKAR